MRTWMQRQLLRIYKKIYHVKKRVPENNSKIKIGNSTKVSSSAILEVNDGGSIQIGDRCRIFEGVIIKTYGGKIIIGDDCSINPYCVIYGHGGLNIGNGVRIATHTVIIPANHNFSAKDSPIYMQGLTAKGIVIEDNVWIGANSTILDNVIIQHGAVIGAGSVVNKNILKESIYAGVPAKKIKDR